MLTTGESKKFFFSLSENEKRRKDCRLKIHSMMMIMMFLSTHSYVKSNFDVAVAINFQ